MLLPGTLSADSCDAGLGIAGPGRASVALLISAPDADFTDIRKRCPSETGGALFLIHW